MTLQADRSPQRAVPTESEKEHGAPETETVAQEPLPAPGPRPSGPMSPRPVITPGDLWGNVAPAKQATSAAAASSTGGPSTPSGEHRELVGDVMTRSLITTGPDVSLASAAILLRHHAISGLPVVRETHLLGVLSEKDILRVLSDRGGFSVASEVIDEVVAPNSPELPVKHARWKGLLERLKVKDAMTAPAITAHPDTTLEVALRWMLLRRVQRLPVTEGPHLEGIITRGDVLSAVEGDR